MDSQLREIGIGDVVVGKHLGKMMGCSAAGSAPIATRWRRGRCTRRWSATSIAASAGRAAVAHVERELLAFRDRLAATPLETLLAGELPA
jgi:cytochrome b pre-mRNA-processing protein 3